MTGAPGISSPAVDRPTPPPQPDDGPGGADYPHARVIRHGPLWADGRERNNAYRYFVYEPADPVPASAPVVLFLHGWQAYRPDMYGAWMAHVARKGYVVVWSQYDRNLIGVWQWARNAMLTWIDALDRLATPGRGFRVRPERDEGGRVRTAIVGHSAGAYLAAILAAKAPGSAGCPVPAAIVALQPARKGWIPGADLSRIDPATKVLLVVGDADYISRFETAVAIWNDIAHISPANKAFLLVQSDDRGDPPLIANHYFPNCDGYRDTACIDARDYFVTFKLSVAALNCAFRGRDCAIAFGHGCPAQVDMGRWSDGVAVTPMICLDPSVDGSRLALRPRAAIRR
jgi:pimeloyl-ACP methyl ester carboxylesterase